MDGTHPFRNVAIIRIIKDFRLVKFGFVKFNGYQISVISELVKFNGFFLTENPLIIKPMIFRR